MSDKMPKGWMDAETARKWARRGAWAYNTGRGATIYSVANADLMRDDIEDGDRWRYIGPNPDDDAPAEPVGMVEVEAWVVVSNSPEGDDLWSCAYNDEDSAAREVDRDRERGRVAKVVRLVGHTAPPVREPVEVVAGEVSDV